MKKKENSKIKSKKKLFIILGIIVLIVAVILGLTMKKSKQTAAILGIEE